MWDLAKKISNVITSYPKAKKPKIPEPKEINILIIQNQGEKN